jgi:YgiT-type zinc finger domain-containing protein
MSSSRQSSPRKRRARRGLRCVTCGKYGVHAVVGDVVLTAGTHSHRFRHVRHDRCTHCGERYFGPEANLRFDEYFLGRKRRPAA